MPIGENPSLPRRGGTLNLGWRYGRMAKRPYDVGEWRRVFSRISEQLQQLASTCNHVPISRLRSL